MEHAFHYHFRPKASSSAVAASRAVKPSRTSRSRSPWMA